MATTGDYAPFSMRGCLPGQDCEAAAAPTAAAGSAASVVPATGAAATPASTNAAAAPASPREGNAPAAAPANELSGFDVEVARRFAADRGYKVEFVAVRWPDLSASLAAGAFDVAMSGVTVRPERSIAGRYSIPVAATQAIAITWPGSGAKTIEDLDNLGKRVAVNAGGHLEKVANQVFRRASVVALADNDAVRMALLDRTFDAVVTDDFEAEVWTKGTKDLLSLPALSTDRKAYLLPADHGALAVELDQWLLQHERDGTLAELRRRFFGEALAGRADAATATPGAAFAAAIGERLSLMPMVWIAKREAGKPILDVAQEAAVVDGAVAALQAGASAAGLAPPDAARARAVFAEVVAMGREAQQQIADRDPQWRRQKQAARSAAEAGGNNAEAGSPNADAQPKSADSQAETAEAQARQPNAPAEPAEAQPKPADAPAQAKPAEASTAPRPGAVPGASRLYDLGTELRPAIARITDKVVRTMLAMDRNTDAAALRADLKALLQPYDVAPARFEALAGAVTAWAASRPAAAR